MFHSDKRYNRLEPPALCRDIRPRVPLLPALLLGWAALADSLFGAGNTLMVTNLEDAGPGSLREQIAAAQSGDTISFAVRGTIILTNGELLISKQLTIVGPGATNLAISARGQSRLLETPPDAALFLYGVTLCDGHAADGSAGSSNSPAGFNGSDGGGIYNAGFLAIVQCVISNCAAGNGGPGFLTRDFNTPDATNWVGGIGGRGGAIYGDGYLALMQSTLISNSSGAGGPAGGTREYGAPGNSGGGGGAIYNEGQMWVTGCAFDSNTAGSGSASYSGYYVMGAPPDGGHPGGSGGDGGAVCDAGGALTVIEDCQFRFNTSGAGGMGSTRGMMYADLALGGPGGPGGRGGAVWTQGPAAMNACTFLSNQTGLGGAGGTGIQTGGPGGMGGLGGAVCASGELSMEHCLCSSNHTGAGGPGGTAFRAWSGSGMSGGSGGAVYAAAELRLTDCVFSGNWAGPGGPGANGASSYYSSYAASAGLGGRGGSGGAVYCESGLAATNCTVSGNQAGNAGVPGTPGSNAGVNYQNTVGGSDGGQGGGVCGSGALVLHACTVSGNKGGDATSGNSGISVQMAVKSSSAEPPPGGSSGSDPRPMMIIYTWVGRPGGAGGTGGIYCENGVQMALCTLSANTGGQGGSGGNSGGGYWQYIPGGAGGPGGPGGINSLSTNEVDLIACTISTNSGGAGGSGGRGVTVPDNSGRTGQGSAGPGGTGGICAATPGATGKAINSILASNFGGLAGAGAPYPGSSGGSGAPDVQGAFASLGHNLVGQINGSLGFTNGINGDLAGSANAPLDPGLGPLADNGGPTFTMALLHGSPALDAGDDALLQSPYFFSTDQRGFPRRSGSHLDIGAFEFQSRDWAAQSPTNTPVLSGASFLDTSNPGSTVPTPSFRLSFSDNTPGATFTVLVSTNLSANSWSVLGQPLQTAPGWFQFTETCPTSCPQRFYRVSSP